MLSDVVPPKRGHGIMVSCLLFVALKSEWMLQLLKLMMRFKCGPPKVGCIRASPIVLNM